MIVLLLNLSQMHSSVCAELSSVVILVAELARIVSVSALDVNQVSIMRNLRHRALAIKHICVQILSSVKLLRKLIVSVLTV